MYPESFIPDDHPLYHPLKLQIQTPAVSQLLEILLQWLWTGSTGGFIEGLPRTGKTTAIKMLRPLLHTRQGWPIPSHVFSAPPRDRGTIQSLYRNLCISADITINKEKNGITDVYLESFYHYLIDRALESQSDQLVLFVDETQRLNINQLEVFAELLDLMAQNGILLSVICTGNDTECDQLLEALKGHLRRHILGRFFTRRTTFKGIENRKDLATCLKEYDTLRHPPVNGPTYTEACLPEAFSNGFRLHHLSKDIWSIYWDYQNRYQIGPWGMKYFSSAIMVLLLDYLPKHGVENFCPEMFECCIDVSGLSHSSVT